ncbi:MAG: sensor histidine kinase [Tissierellaceae bacterium]
MSLRSKIITAFTLCIILTFTPILFILQTHVKDSNMKQLESQTLQLISSKSTEIGSWLNQRISEIRIIHEYPPSKNLDFKYLKPYLTNLNIVLRNQYGNPNETFAIGGLQGHGWINDEITIDVSQRDYFFKAINEDVEYVISNPVISKSDNTHAFIICYPITDENGKKIGFINGAVNLELLSKIAEEINIYDGFSWIMNKNADTYSILKEDLIEKYISADGLAKIIDGSLEKNSGTIETKNIANKDTTVFFSSIPYTENWILCTMVENHKIHAQTNSIINLVLTFGMILLGISILLAILVSGSIVKPIHRLKENMIQVSKGNLNSYYVIKNKDEISILGNVFNNMLDDLKKSIDEVYRVQNQKRSAELRALQSQINPHFLYNTLDTIQWKSLDYNAFEVADMINALSKFFRISLSDGREFITIADEIEHVRNYLKIQEVRYHDKMDYTINVDNDIDQYLVPKMIIQPLVENSIYHGLKPRRERGNIIVNINLLKPYISIEVIDTGIGMDTDKLKSIQENLINSYESEYYGLYNVNERLKLSFKDKYRLIIKSEKDKGTKITILIPIISEGFQCLEQ